MVRYQTTQLPHTPGVSSAQVDPQDVHEAQLASRAPELKLSDFLDIQTLQEIQDSFTSVTRLRATIRNAQGEPLTQPTDSLVRDQSNEMLESLIAADTDEPGKFIAPIFIEGQEIGSLAVEANPLSNNTHILRERSDELAKLFDLNEQQIEHLMCVVEQSFAPSKAAAVQFLHLLAHSIAMLCYEKYQSYQRVEELTVLYKLSTVLTGVRDLQQVLDVAVRSVGEVMNVKAVCIRLLDDEHMLEPRAVYELSDEYLEKGKIELSHSKMFQEAIESGICYVSDMSSDPRVLYPQDAKREGLVSMLCASIVFQGNAIGTIQVFSEALRRFTDFEHHLLRAIAQLLATAIETTRLEEQRQEGLRMARQLHLAADVQRRMMPTRMPELAPFEVAARYVPSLELSGDFYDFIDLNGHLGIAVGDVVGKGVAASLMMASVRASLRAYAQDLYNLNEIISRVNYAMTKDTLDHEFATLWYGVLDPKKRRLTYCNAGHEPPLLYRDGKIQLLNVGGMIVGVDKHQMYDMAIVDLQPDDVLLLYTDGLSEAFNFENESFGRERVEQAVRESAQGSAQEVLNHVLWQKRRFTGIQQSGDDLTLVVVKVGQ